MSVSAVPSSSLSPSSSPSPTSPQPARRGAAGGPAPDADPEFDWRTRAACLALPPEAVLGTDPAQAASVLAACGGCPIREACRAVVDPENHWFDGVSGGRLWRNGRDITPRVARVMAGTASRPAQASRPTLLSRGAAA